MNTAIDFDGTVNLLAHNDAPRRGQKGDFMGSSGMDQDNSAASMAYADVVRPGLKSDNQSPLDTLYQCTNWSPATSPSRLPMASRNVIPFRGVFDHPNQQRTPVQADSADIGHITSSIAQVALQDARMVPGMTSQRIGEGLTEITTYAEATNVAQFFPELASTVLHQPLPFSIHLSPNFEFKNIKEPAPQVAEHTYDRPNWAIAPEETPAKPPPVDISNWALVRDEKALSARNPSRMGSPNRDSPSSRKPRGRKAMLSRHDPDRRDNRPRSKEPHKRDVLSVSPSPALSHCVVPPPSQISSSSTPYPDLDISRSLRGLRTSVGYEGANRHGQNRHSFNDALPRYSDPPFSSSHQQASRQDCGARGDRQSRETYQPSQWLKVWDESQGKHLDQLSDSVRLQEPSIASRSQPASFGVSLGECASPVCQEGRVFVAPLMDDISRSMQRPLPACSKPKIPYKCTQSGSSQLDCGEGYPAPGLAFEAFEENSLHEATMSNPQLPIFSTIRGNGVPDDGCIVGNPCDIRRSDSSVPLPLHRYKASEECAMAPGSVEERSQVSSPSPTLEITAKFPQRSSKGKVSAEFGSSDAAFSSLHTGSRGSTSASAEFNDLDSPVSPQRPRDAVSNTSEPAGRVSRRSDVTDRLRTSIQLQDDSAICPSDATSPRKRQRSSSLRHKKSLNEFHIPFNQPSSSDTDTTSLSLDIGVPKAPGSVASHNRKRSKRQDGLSWRSVNDSRRDQPMGPKYIPPPARSVSFRSTKITREFQEGRGYTFRLEPLEPEQEIVKSATSPMDWKEVGESEHGQEERRSSTLSTPGPKHDSELVAQVKKGWVSPSATLSPSRIASPLADVRRLADNAGNTSPLLPDAGGVMASPSSSFWSVSSGKGNDSAIPHIYQQAPETDWLKGKSASDKGKENNTQSSDSPVSSPRIHHSPLMSRSVGAHSSLVTQVTGSSTLTWAPSCEFIPKQSSLGCANSKLRSLDDPSISSSEEILNLGPSGGTCGLSRTGVERQIHTPRELFEARLQAHNIRIQQAQAKQHESISRGEIIDISSWAAPTSTQRTLRHRRPSDHVIQLPAQSPTFDFSPISRAFGGSSRVPRSNAQSTEVLYVANAVPDQHLHRESAQSSRGPIENSDFWIPVNAGNDKPARVSSEYAR